MKNKVKTKIHFILDPKLISEERAGFLIRVLNEEKIKYVTDAKDLDGQSLVIIFSHKKSLKNYSSFKNKILVIDSNDDVESPTLEKINLNSYEEVARFCEKLFLIEKRLALQNKIKESERLFEKIKLQNLNRSSDELEKLTYEQNKEIVNLLSLEVLLLKEENLKNWNMHFRNYSKKHLQIQQMLLYHESELFEDDALLDESSLVFHLPFNNLFLFLKFKSSEFINDAFYIELIISLILRTIQIQDQQLIKSDGEIDFWKKIFSKIPYPMAVISNLGDLLIYNESFAKIGILPKECLRYKDQESLELFQQFYKVRRIEFPINLINVSYFVFYTSEDAEPAQREILGNETRKNSVDELGIISSSIAHELNNPLAGILAALSLLSLEDGWSEENRADLEDMRNGAKRCKELVEIFLGFSRFSPGTGNNFSIKASVDQAINLLRFRMIESNLRLEIKYTPTLETFSHQINSSIMSMILYLLFSELMTAFAHERLILHSHIPSISGEVLEFSNQIIIKLEHDFEYEEKLAQSKLIQHLLVFEKLEFTFLRQEIRLIYRV